MINTNFIISGFLKYHFDEQNDWNLNIIVNSSVDFLSQFSSVGSTQISTMSISTFSLELEYKRIIKQSYKGIKRNLSDTLDCTILYYIILYYIRLILLYYHIMLKVDHVLKHCNLQQNTTYYYNIRNFLFYSISYLLQYNLETSIMLRVNSISHLKSCFANNTPKAFKTRLMKLNEFFKK